MEPVPDLTSRSILAGEAAAATAELEAALRPSSDPTAAAFFDVDNTIMRGASIFHLAHGMYRRRLFRPRDLLRFSRQQIVFRVSGVERSGDVRSVREAALAFIAGQRVSDLVGLGEEIYDEVMAAKVWPGTRALAQIHLDAGQRVWLVTATPVEIAEIIAARLGLSGAIGTVSETVDGVYTGRLVGDILHGPAKAVAVRALAEREGLDLNRCTAYSDSYNDLPLLELVGQAWAINPDPRLRRYAKLKGWRIRDYRTGRKAALLALAGAAASGAIVGGIGAAVAIARRNRKP